MEKVITINPEVTRLIAEIRRPFIVKRTETPQTGDVRMFNYEAEGHAIGMSLMMTNTEQAAEPFPGAALEALDLHAVRKLRQAVVMKDRDTVEWAKSRSAHTREVMG